MGTIKAIIEFIPSDRGNIDYQATVLPLNHEISNPIALNTLHAGGIQPFILGSSRLGTKEQGGDGHYFWGAQEEWRSGKQVGGRVEWFISKQVADAEGNLNPPLVFTIIGSDIDHFTMHFDSTVRQWATKIIVDGREFLNDDATFMWSGATANTHTVQIRQWNTPNFHVRITGLTLGITLEYGRSKIKRIIAGSRSTFDGSKPSSGVIPQYGSIELIDTDDNFLELNQLKLLKPLLPVRIYLNAPDKLLTESNESYAERIKNYMVGDYLTERFTYSFGDTKVSVDLSDSILEWGKIFFAGIGNDEGFSAGVFLNKLKAVSPVEVMVSDETKAYLNQIMLPDGFLPQGSLLDAWNTFCDATMTVLTKNIKGEIWLT